MLTILYTSLQREKKMYHWAWELAHASISAWSFDSSLNSTWLRKHWREVFKCADWIYPLSACEACAIYVFTMWEQCTWLTFNFLANNMSVISRRCFRDDCHSLLAPCRNPSLFLIGVNWYGISRVHILWIQTVRANITFRQRMWTLIPVIGSCACFG